MKKVQLELIEQRLGAGLAQTLREIDSVRDDILAGKRWRPANAETLSRASVKLAAHNSYLGEFVAEAEYYASQLKGHYKLTFEQAKLEYIEQKKTVAEAEARALERTQEALENMNNAAYLHKLLALKRADTSDLIDAIRSRLSRLTKEREQLR